MKAGIKRLNIPRAYQAVHEALEEAILSGELPAGEPLPTETDLADRFGVTRHTVREGIRVLEQSGFVARAAGRRLHVIAPRYNELAPRASRALLMQKVTFRELWEVAIQLEDTAADLAANSADKSFVDQLDVNVAEMKRVHSEGGSIIPLDVAFHTIIAEATKNRVLLLAREPVSLLFYPSLNTLFDHPVTATIGPKRLIEAHSRLTDAFREGDAELARAWMRKHMIDFRRGYELAGIDIDGVADSKVRHIQSRFRPD